MQSKNINGFLNSDGRSCFCGRIVKETNIINHNDTAITMKDFSNSEFSFVCLKSNLLKK